MALFDNFRETIFLKENSDLEKQLNDLKSLREKMINKEQIDKDIKLLEYGIQGENNIAFELKNSNLGLYVLHDVTFEVEGSKAQIDYLIFSKGNFYIIECKNLVGDITVDSTGQFIRSYEYKGKTIRESVYSPFSQARRHQDILKKVWSNKHKTLNKILYSKLDNNWFRPVVVLSNPKSILNIKYAPKEIKNNIIKADQLISYIKKDLSKIDKYFLYSKKYLKETAEIWLSRTVENKTNLADKYINSIIKVDNNELLILKLKEFRKKRSTEMKMPPFYIFTDEELEKIISLMPKSIQELKEILPEIKIKCHGKEIINVINQSN